MAKKKTKAPAKIGNVNPWTQPVNQPTTKPGPGKIKLGISHNKRARGR